MGSPSTNRLSGRLRSSIIVSASTSSVSEGARASMIVSTSTLLIAHWFSFFYDIATIKKAHVTLILPRFFA